MATLFKRTFTYVELSAGSYDSSGDFVRGERTDSEVKGTIQAVTADDLLAIPEGSRQSGTVKVYSSEKLKARTQNSDGAAGYVKSPAGIWYELVQEMPFQNLPKIAHWKYLACEIPAAQVPEALNDG